MTDQETRVRWVHAALVRDLHLPSPLGDALAVLDRLSAVELARQVGTQAARDARAALARQVALGEREFGEDALREWAAQSVWVSDFEAPGSFPAASMLGEAVARSAQGAASMMFAAAAPQVFETARVACAEEIRKLEALPAPPRGLWTAPDPAGLLVRAKGHETTLTVLAGVGDRYHRLQEVAAAVRDLAGAGIERFPSGSSRVALTFRDWRRAHEQEGNLRTTDGKLRLWRTVCDGWGPGIWRAEDVAAPTTEENSFAGRLARLGAAVGLH